MKIGFPQTYVCILTKLKISIIMSKSSHIFSVQLHTFVFFLVFLTPIFSKIKLRICRSKYKSTDNSTKNVTVFFAVKPYLTSFSSILWTSIINKIWILHSQEFTSFKVIFNARSNANFFLWTNKTLSTNWNKRKIFSRFSTVGKPFFPIMFFKAL